jgi:hypothetical protein
MWMPVLYYSCGDAKIKNKEKKRRNHIMIKKIIISLFALKSLINKKKEAIVNTFGYKKYAAKLIT